jgi:hypothetical protein
MDTIFGLNRRRSSPLRPIAAAASLAVARQGYDVEGLIPLPSTPARARRPSGFSHTVPHRQSFPRAKASLFAVLAVLGGLLFASAFVERPATTVSAPLGLDVRELEMTRSGDLPLFESEYRRHYGVLDTLER